MNLVPKISVVTIAFNDLSGLRQTMESVLSQTYPNIEYIVIDGGSRDGSAELIKENAAKIAYWISEPDQGTYAALNKGATRCTGEWVVFMNSGDDFANADIVQQVSSSLLDPSVSFVYGDKIVKYESYEVISKAGPVANLWMGSQFSHQSVFIRNSVQKEHPYNLKNRISADFEFFFSSYAAGQRFVQLNLPVSRVSAGGISDRDRLENIAAFYRVVRSLRPALSVHGYYLSMLVMQFVKLSLKRLLPEQWIHRYRRAFRKLV
jgi:glycosyltransferase involved in cell wall biosynthesis